MPESMAGPGLRRSQLRTFPDEKIVYTIPDDEKIPAPPDCRSEKIFVPQGDSQPQVWAPSHDDKIYVPHHSQQDYPHPYRQSSYAPANYGYPQDKPHYAVSPGWPQQYPQQYSPSGPPPYMNGEYRTSQYGAQYYGSQYPQEKSYRYSTVTNPSSPSSYGLEPIANLSISDDRSVPSTPRSARDSLPSQQRQTVKTPMTLSTLLASPVRIGKGDIWNTASETAIYSMGTEARNDISSLSSKALLAVRRSHDKSAMGYIQFPKQAGSDIMMFINAQATRMSHSGLLHPRWEFTSTTGSTHEEKWHWKRDKMSGGVILMGGKKSGTQLARMKGDHLYFEKSANINEANFDEVVLSAIAIAEAVRRAGRDKTKDAANSMASALFADSASVLSGNTTHTSQSAKSTLSVKSAQSGKSVSSQGSGRSGRTSWSYS